MGNELTTREATRQVRLHNWQQVIADCQNSGLTIREYCRQNGITKDKYYYWLRKSKEAMIESNPIFFAELSPARAPIEESVGHSAITLRINGAIIDINGTVSEDMLHTVIRAVKNA